MSKYIPTTTIDLGLARIATADEEAVCTQFPNTYYNACRPPLWVAETAYTEGDLVRPPTDNNFIYECTTSGTSGASEPPWGTMQDAMFTDDSVTWKSHENFSLALTTLDEADKVIGDRDGGGRKLVIAEKMGIISHRSGAVSHTALLNSTGKTIELVTTATTTAPADNDIVSGRTTIFHSMTVNNTFS